jgi:hypothetical protein
MMAVVLASKGGRMSPLFRIWAAVAIALAVLFALRGAWVAALAVLLASPAPALAFDRGRQDATRSSMTWLAAVALAAGALLALLLVVVASGGVPQVHEWRALLRS